MRLNKIDNDTSVVLMEKCKMWWNNIWELSQTRNSIDNPGTYNTSDIPFSPKEERHQIAGLTSIHCTGNKFNFQMHHHVHIFYPLAQRPSTERYPLAIKLSSTIMHFFFFSNTRSKCPAANWNLNTKRPFKLAIL